MFIELGILFVGAGAAEPNAFAVVDAGTVPKAPIVVLPVLTGADVCPNAPPPKALVEPNADVGAVVDPKAGVEEGAPKADPLLPRALVDPKADPPPNALVDPKADLPPNAEGFAAAAPKAEGCPKAEAPPPKALVEPKADPPPNALVDPKAEPPPKALVEPNADPPAPPPSALVEPNADPPPNAEGLPNADTPPPLPKALLLPPPNALVVVLDPNAPPVFVNGAKGALLAAPPNGPE